MKRRITKTVAVFALVTSSVIGIAAAPASACAAGGNCGPTPADIGQFWRRALDAIAKLR